MYTIFYFCIFAETKNLFPMKNKNNNDDALLTKVTCLGDMRVMLDCDVAEILETTPTEILEAVRDNLPRFRNNDLIMLEETRWKRKLVETERFAKVPKSKLPVFAFTADGMLTLSTVLKSNRAHLLCRMIVKTYSTVVDLRYVLQSMSLSDNDDTQEKLMQESGRLLNELFGITESDGSSAVSFRLRKHIDNQPVASEGYFNLVEENARLQQELETANRQLQELNRGIFRNKGVS